ncbi:MAG: hypothetical protein MI919_27825 [Holophagales bacterium]|nr:hypothetical protein [Holophagales bacterium]
MYRRATPPSFPAATHRALAWALLSALVVAPVAGDDRSLLRDASGEPYVFVVLDTSGSMHWSTPCDENDMANDIDPWDNKCTFECPLSDAECAKVCPHPAGATTEDMCIEWDMDASASTPIEVIVDNSDTSKVTRSGPWNSWTADAYGPNYFYTTTGAGPAWITYTTALPESGDYLVYAYWSARTFRVEDARLTLEHADGTNYLEIDQGDLGTHAQFNYLGTFRFDSAQDAKLTISTVETGGGSVSADAIRFYRLPKPAGATCLRTGYRCQQDLCPRGDCPLPLGADDPASKFFQAREAMYEVIRQVPNVHFGFSTYDLTNIRLRFKHYLYRVAETRSNGSPNPKFSDYPAASGLVDLDWPIVDAREVFGTGPLENIPSNFGGYSEWGFGEGGNDPYNEFDTAYAVFDCARRGAPNPGHWAFDDDEYIGCIADYPADVLDIWEIDRFLRIPKLGQDGRRQTWLFMRDSDGKTYRIDYEFGSGNLGDDEIVVQLDLNLCTGGDCRDSSERTNLIDDMEVTYKLVSDFAEYQGAGTYRYPNMRSRGFFGRSSSILAQEGFNDPVLGNVDLTCTGLEQNYDWQANIAPYDSFVDNNHDDAWWDYAITWEWIQDPRGDNDIAENPLGPTYPRSWLLDDGDFNSLDWDDTHNELLLQKLAPNAFHLDTNNEPVATGAEPDFRTASYFRDLYDPAEPSGAQSHQNGRRLRLRDERERPPLAFGRTPLDDSMEDFREWYAGSQDCQADRSDGTLPATYPCGWRDYAQAQDTDFACRQRYVLFLTDGVETCNPIIDAVCDETLDLNTNFGVRTFVVGFGFPDADDSLLCMADNGGTTAPFLPRNKKELVDALTAIFDKVKAESRSFASASIPAVQSTAADKIYLSSFTPLPSRSIWPGRLDVFRQPLPLGDDNRPRIDLQCGVDTDADGNPLQSGCHVYDVAERILSQTPEPEDVDLASGTAPDFHIGMADDQRRLIYGQSNPDNIWPGPLRLLLPPEGYSEAPADLVDLGWGILQESFMADYEAMIHNDTDLLNEIDAAIVEIVKRKTEVLTDGDGFEVGCTGQEDNTPCTYVMGDIFHANPLVVASPDNFSFFRTDQCGEPAPTDELNNCIPADDFASAEEMRRRGYREFTRRNVWRRRMLAAFTNDGQIHFFDSGRYASVDIGNGDFQEVLTDGSGRELFAYMPRMIMPVVRDQIHGNKHIYSMDGTATIADVFIDPVQELDGSYVATDREWRTVMVGGVREAGDIFDDPLDVMGFQSGYYALDITTPDALEQVERGGAVANIYAPYVPSGGGSNMVPDCMAFTNGSQLQTTVTECRTLAGEEIPFPAEIWAFDDSTLVEVSPAVYERFYLDEDRNGVNDLGRTWSKPLIAQIPVCSGHTSGLKCNIGGDVSEVETRWVAIFGGGLDPENLNAPEEGNFLFMVDMESGEILYKRQLQGAAPSDPAGLDIDNDGVVDRIYIGTTDGLLYKVDLQVASSTTGGYPGLETVTLDETQLVGWPGSLGTASLDFLRIADPAWEPFQIASTGGLPLYYPPAIFRIPESDFYGLAFGGGDREDLWRTNTAIGKFFVIVDEEFVSTDPQLPVDETVLENIDWEGVSPDENLLIRQKLVDSGTGQVTQRPGWVMTFDPNMRTITEPFILAGIVVFSVFDPDVTPVVGAGGAEVVCARSGDTYAFVVSLENGAALDPTLESDPSFGCGGRCELISEFTTALHLERSSTKNPSSGGGLGNSRQFDEELANAIREAIMDRMPRTCQFNPSYELVVSALRNSTGVSVYARVPMVVCPGDWRN